MTAKRGRLDQYLALTEYQRKGLAIFRICFRDADDAVDAVIEQGYGRRAAERLEYGRVDIDHAFGVYRYVQAVSRRDGRAAFE